MGAVAALLGLNACSGDDDADDAEDDDADEDAAGVPESRAERVIVVGAGPAGMSAAHLLLQAGLDTMVLEAGPSYGGRIKHDTDFVDFPIPLGAEWLHVEPDELGRIVADPSVEIDIEFRGYGGDDVSYYIDVANDEYVESDVDDSDLKFVGTTWFGFFEEYVVPGVESAMRFDTPVARVEHDADGVVITDTSGEAWEADRVIVAVPLQILQDGDIEFVPALPTDQQEAIDAANIWAGMKVFIEFAERFYPTFVETPDSYTDEGQRLYYDAAHGQDSDANVLGLFSVGAQAEAFQALDDGELIAEILAELDEMSDGVASASYLRHRTQNWNAEPFIRSGYLADVESWRLPPRLSEPVGDRVYFAGEAFTEGEDWGGVHDAARSARRAVRAILR